MGLQTGRRHAEGEGEVTPLQFAKEQCSNYQSDGSCLGMGIRDDGSPYCFGRKQKCVLVDKERCKFFEECVLPMGIDPVNARNEQRLREKDEAIRLYASDHEKSLGKVLSKGTGRLCPHCRKRELEPSKQLCYVCREQREKDGARDRQRKRRSDVTES